MRLIDADAFIRFLAEQKVKETGAFTTGVNKALNIAISALKNPQITPTVDAVPEHFCSYGERKAKNDQKTFCKAGHVSRAFPERSKLHCRYCKNL